MYFSLQLREAAFKAGLTAKQQGKKYPRDNPYDYRAQRELYQRWRDGFRHTESPVDQLKGFGQAEPKETE